MNIFLVGYMGSGKTTVGKPLAKKLDMGFFDMDNYFVHKHKRSINDVFEENGEGFFRQLERDIVIELCSNTDAVIATGGGAPCYFDNMDTMNAAGLTIYLKVSPEGLVKRLKHRLEKRPLLKGKTEDELLDFITEKLAQREAYYSKSKLIVACDGYSDTQIVDRIAEIINQNNNL